MMALGQSIPMLMVTVRHMVIVGDELRRGLLAQVEARHLLMEISVVEARRLRMVVVTVGILGLKHLPMAYQHQLQAQAAGREVATEIGDTRRELPPRMPSTHRLPGRTQLQHQQLSAPPLLEHGKAVRGGVVSAQIQPLLQRPALLHPQLAAFIMVLPLQPLMQLRPRPLAGHDTTRISKASSLLAGLG